MEGGRWSEGDGARERDCNNDISNQQHLTPDATSQAALPLISHVPSEALRSALGPISTARHFGNGHGEGAGGGEGGREASRHGSSEFHRQHDDRAERSLPCMLDVD